MSKRFTLSDIDKLSQRGIRSSLAKVEPIKYDYIIGIDCGTNTGYAVWDCLHRSLATVNCLKIHTAMQLIADAHKRAKIMVIFEDARLVKFRTDAVKAQGAGSVKRDAVVWEDYLTDLRIPFKGVRPNKAITKMNNEDFKKLTGWEQRTNSHARDAAMMIFNWNK